MGSSSFFSNSLTVCSRVLFNLIIVMFSARVLNITDLGSFFLLLTIANIAGAFVELGLGTRLVKELSRTDNVKYKFLKFKQLQSVKYLGFLLPLPFIYLYMLSLGIQELYSDCVLLYLSVAIGWHISHILIYIRANGGWYRETFFTFIGSLVLALVFIAVYVSDSITLDNLISGVLASRLIQYAVISISLEFPKLSLFTDPVLVRSKAYKESIPYFFAYFLGILFINLDVLIASYFLTKDDLALYQGAIRVVLVLTMGTVVINNLLIAKLAKFGNRTYREKLVYSHQVLKWPLVGVLALALIIYLTDNFLFVLLLGGNFDEISNFAGTLSLILIARYYLCLFQCVNFILQSAYIKFVPLLLADVIIVLAVLGLENSLSISSLLHVVLFSYVFLIFVNLLMGAKNEPS